MLQTPVVFLIFKRPQTTARVFEVIRQAKPSKLLVVADGPRVDRLEEAEKCAATRKIIDQVDWNCQVYKNYSEVNLGCARRVSSGLSWAFEQVEEAIILEDDCIVHPTFFRFCEELLAKYQSDERIMSIAASNFQFGRHRNDYSYYFSRYHHCWGWATWKRAWQYFNFEMKLWFDVLRMNLLKDILRDDKAIQVWQKTFQCTYDGKVDSWANRWMLSCWLQGGLSILPQVNLVSNIGFVEDATNTGSEPSIYSNMNLNSIEFPLKHPPFIISDLSADKFTQDTLFDYHPNLIKRVRKKLSKISHQLLPKNNN
ncbi:MAG: glycosyltransferase family 2 protein [Trichodesmium sp.]